MTVTIEVVPDRIDQQQFRPATRRGPGRLREMQRGDGLLGVTGGTGAQADRSLRTTSPGDGRAGANAEGTERAAVQRSRSARRFARRSRPSRGGRSRGPRSPWTSIFQPSTSDTSRRPCAGCRRTTPRSPRSDIGARRRSRALCLQQRSPGQASLRFVVVSRSRRIATAGSTSKHVRKPRRSPTSSWRPSSSYAMPTTSTTMTPLGRG